MSEFEQMQRLHRAVHDDSNTMMALLQTIIERQDIILDNQGKLTSELTGHMEREERAISTWLNSLPRRVDGSPDVDGHREFHQELIEEARARKTMWRELRTEIVKKGAWGIVLVLSALVVYWWNHEVKR